MKKLRFGIVGTGCIAHRFANAIKNVDCAELRAVASRTAEGAEKFGDEFDTSIIPPDLKSNRRPVPPPPPTEEGIQFQIGANSGEENTLTINTNFSLNGFDADVTTREDALETVDKVDALIGEFSTMRSALGAAQNRLESVMDSLTTKNNNLSASHSTIVDTDFALESANLVKAQILQNATAALLAQANSAPSIAMRLLE